MLMRLSRSLHSYFSSSARSAKIPSLSRLHQGESLKVRQANWELVIGAMKRLGLGRWAQAFPLRLTCAEKYVGPFNKRVHLINFCKEALFAKSTHRCTTDDLVRDVDAAALSSGRGTAAVNFITRFHEQLLVLKPALVEHDLEGAARTGRTSTPRPRRTRSNSRRVPPSAAPSPHTPRRASPGAMKRAKSYQEPVLSGPALRSSSIAKERNAEGGGRPRVRSRSTSPEKRRGRGGTPRRGRPMAPPSAQQSSACTEPTRPPGDMMAALHLQLQISTANKQKLSTPPRSPTSSKNRTITHDEVLSAERASIYKRIGSATEGNVPTVKLHEIEKQQLLGRGRFSSVFSGIWTKEASGSGGGFENIAIKEFMYNHDKEVPVNVLKVFLQEIIIMKRSSHRRIIGMKGVVAKPHPMILLELMEIGSLRGVMTGDPEWFKLTLEDKMRLTSNIAEGLSYLHDIRIVHRDLKSHNILLTVQQEGGHRASDEGAVRWVAKIGDLGSAAVSMDA